MVIAGFTGRLGQGVLPSLLSDPEIKVAGGISRQGSPRADFPVFQTAAEALKESGASVLLDTSHREGALERTQEAFNAGADVVCGVTGIAPETLAQISASAARLGRRFLLVPNFAIGAVLMMKLSEIAAQWMPNVEIIEMHHDRKEDAPSGTAMMTLDRLINARTRPASKKPAGLMKLDGARGGEKDGIHVHSVRLPGFSAHQEVIFGAPGEGLTIRHDAFDRTCYGPGAVLCVKEVGRLAPGLHTGLDAVLFGAAVMQT